MRTPLTPWEEFKARWSSGCGGDLCKQPDTCVVLARGDVPADILFIAQGPGASENALGRPLVGPAGHLLDHDGRPPGIVQRAGLVGKYRLAFTNLVGCIPRDEYGDKDREPDSAEIVQCSRRLREFVALCNPRLVVAVGAIAEKWLMGRKPLLPDYAGRYVTIRHPSFILKSVSTFQPLMVKECVVKLQNAVEIMENPAAYDDSARPSPPANLYVPTDDDIPF